MRLSLLETHLAAQQSAGRQAKLHSLEAILIEARLAAESIDEPVLGYFIDMAIAEVRGITTVDQETPGTQDGRKSNVNLMLLGLGIRLRKSLDQIDDRGAHALLLDL